MTKDYENKRTRMTGGFTLMELVVVICILGIVSSIAIWRFTGVADRAKMTAAQSDMVAIREALVGSRYASGYLDDMGAIPGFSPANIRLANLLMATNLYGICGRNVAGDERMADSASPDEFQTWSAERNRGWRGPYLRDCSGRFPNGTDRRGKSDTTYAERGFFPRLVNVGDILPEDYVRGEKGCSVYGFPGEPAIEDPWGNPYVIQVPPPQAFENATGVTAAERFRYARIVSAGPDGLLSAPCFPAKAVFSLEEKRFVRLAGMLPDGTSPARGDDLVLFLQRSDIYEE